LLQDGVHYKGSQESNPCKFSPLLTEEQLDSLMQSNFNSPYEDDIDTELYYDCYGDDYATEVINSIGFFKAHYGEV
jgi:hypothetical protein